MPPQTTLHVRVRYAECDPMGLAHHAAYPVWLEMARTELLRESGVRYADLERQGVFIVVARLNMSFHQPARYDDAIAVTATLKRSGGAKIEHDYQVTRDGRRLCTASTVLACVDRDGRPMRVPDNLTGGMGDA
jgi:acyl-CoA thioester hydrolase